MATAASVARGRIQITTKRLRAHADDARSRVRRMLLQDPPVPNRGGTRDRARVMLEETDLAPRAVAVHKVGARARRVRKAGEKAEAAPIHPAEDLADDEEEDVALDVDAAQSW